jgi:hypothetical protein
LKATIANAAIDTALTRRIATEFDRRSRDAHDDESAPARDSTKEFAPAFNTVR